MKNKKAWIVIGVIVLAFGGCFGDRYIAYALVDYYCEKDAGIFVYEVVNLDESYLIPLHSDLRKVDSRFYVNEMYMLNKPRLQKDYEITNHVINNIFTLGPVVSISSYVIRKTDNKVLGEVKTFRAYKGWLANKFSTGRTPRSDCPSLNSEKDFNFEMHKSLIKNIFKIRR